MEEYAEAAYDYLEKLDLNPRQTPKGWSIRCPWHDDSHNSAIYFADDGFIGCQACNERKHINILCKENGDKPILPLKDGRMSMTSPKPATEKPATKKQPPLKRGNFTDMWLDLDLLPSDLEIKGVPAVELNKRGWRWFPGNGYIKEGVFIPYFNTTRDQVGFYQIRHLKGERRFTFAPGVSPMCYGFENLPLCDKFLAYTEGSRDAVILSMAGIPAVALPSCSSDGLLRGLCDYCSKNSLTLLAVCDKDEAGDELVRKLTCPAFDMRTPVGKDIGDFFEQKGLEAIRQYYEPFAPKTL